MKSTIESDPLETELRKLETNLETPVVPGELSTWLRNVRNAFDTTCEVLRRAIDETHETRFQEIADQDSALLPRVQQLREADKELLEESQTLNRKIAELEKGNADRTANQPHSDERVDRLAKRGIDFVIQARTQENAVSTWLMEAFQRDRGVAD